MSGTGSEPRRTLTLFRALLSDGKTGEWHVQRDDVGPAVVNGEYEVIDVVEVVGSGHDEQAEGIEEFAFALYRDQVFPHYQRESMVRSRWRQTQESVRDSYRHAARRYAAILNAERFGSSVSGGEHE